MSDPSETPRTPWGWLRGFGWFLLAWPLLGLAGLGELDDDADWVTVSVAILGPAAIGAVLLAVEWALTRFFGRQLAQRPQPVPNVYRDISNTALTYVTFLALGTTLGLIVEPESAVEPDSMRRSLLVGGVTGGTAVLFRALSLWRHGSSRQVDLGAAWGKRPEVLRFMGYLFMIPMMLLTAVMLTYAVSPGGDDEFGLAAWITLPLVLLLAQRSAMVRAPRYWARSPWEVWLRDQSLTLPWWGLAVLLTVGFVILAVLMPFDLDGSMSTTGQVLGGVLLTPMGLITAWFLVVSLRQAVPRFVRRHRVASALAKGAGTLISWRPEAGDGHSVTVALDDGRRATFVDARANEGASPLRSWLEEHHPDLEGA